MVTKVVEESLENIVLQSGVLGLWCGVAIVNMPGHSETRGHMQECVRVQMGHLPE